MLRSCPSSPGPDMLLVLVWQTSPLCLLKLQLWFDSRRLPYTHTSFSRTLIHIHRLTLPRMLSVYSSLSNNDSRSDSRVPWVYQALGFLFSAGWGNDMVVVLTAVAVKQQICFTTAPFLSVYVRVMECVLSSGGVPSTLASRSEQWWTMFLFHLFSFFLFHPLFLSRLIETDHMFSLLCDVWKSFVMLDCHWDMTRVWISSSYCRVLFLHLPGGLSRVGKGCSGANYSNGFCAQ